MSKDSGSRASGQGGASKPAGEDLGRDAAVKREEAQNSEDGRSIPDDEPAAIDLDTAHDRAS